MKKKKRKKRKINFLHIIFLIILFNIFGVIINQNKLMRNLEGKKMVLQSEIDVLKDEVEDLTEELENSESLEFVEKVARDELGMVKPREIIVIDKNKIKNNFFSIFKGDRNWLILSSDIYWNWKYFEGGITYLCLYLLEKSLKAL